VITHLLAAVAAPAAEQAAMSPVSAIAWALVLLILAAALALVEFLVVSWGMLLVGSVISALVAISLAFHASTTVGWCFVAVVPFIGFFTVRFGFGLMRRNPAAILPTEITADVGIRHAAERAGVAVGALGELSTNAFPTGRARFNGPHGPVELDVQVQGAVLSRGDRVVVLLIDGPIITVGAAPDTVSAIIDSNLNQGSPHA
jgi:membrane-bound ClpP family serine protease